MRKSVKIRNNISQLNSRFVFDESRFKSLPHFFVFHKILLFYFKDVNIFGVGAINTGRNLPKGTEKSPFSVETHGEKC